MLRNGAYDPEGGNKKVLIYQNRAKVLNTHCILEDSSAPDEKSHTVNKNAFQWDAYRPLVDRIPACTVCGGGGIPACTGQGACVGIPACNGQGGVYLGVSAQGGVCHGGVCLWSGGGLCVSQHAMGQTPQLWTDRHL